jgi:hypothetical protein
MSSNIQNPTTKYTILLRDPNHKKKMQQKFHVSTACAPPYVYVQRIMAKLHADGAQWYNPSSQSKRLHYASSHNHQHAPYQANSTRGTDPRLVWVLPSIAQAQYRAITLSTQHPCSAPRLTENRPQHRFPRHLRNRARCERS